MGGLVSSDIAMPQLSKSLSISWEPRQVRETFEFPTGETDIPQNSLGFREAGFWAGVWLLLLWPLKQFLAVSSASCSTLWPE